MFKGIAGMGKSQVHTPIKIIKKTVFLDVYYNNSDIKQKAG